MAKEIETFIKLQVKGGAANPAPPVGPALGSKGVNIMEFCKRFNARTQDTPPAHSHPTAGGSFRGGISLHRGGCSAHRA